MNPIRIALTLLALAVVASAGNRVGTGTGTGFGRSTGTGTGTGRGTGTGTGAGRGTGTGTGAGVRVASARSVLGRLGRVPVPEGGILSGIGHSVSALHPSTWLNKVSEHVPSIENVSFGNLLRMPVTASSALLKAIFEHSGLTPSKGQLYTPNMSELNMYLIQGNGNVSVPLDNVSVLKNYPSMSTGQVTMFISGIVSNPEDPADPVGELIEAYRERYQLKENQVQYTNSWDAPTTGNLIVIDLGNCLNTFRKWVTVDIKSVGEMIGKTLTQMTEFVPYDQIHLIGHNVGAHVAGVAARYYTQEKGTQLRRVTGLDPSNVFTRKQQIELELRSGCADQVDVIHTTSYGAGSEANGDADYYPSGAGSVPASSNNIIDAFYKALHYYAETVKPGNERNFMAVECNSLEDYENHHCHGIRIPMGYSAPQDAKGNFILRVNSNAPYGRNARRLAGKAHSLAY